MLVLLGSLLPVVMAWVGVGVAAVLTIGIFVELLWRRRVRDHLRAIDLYLPRPTAWERSARLVRYSPLYDRRRGVLTRRAA